MSDIVIGIDLGTTNSSVCLHRNNKLTFLENNEGHRATSSFAYFGDNILIGQYAQEMAAKKPENGVYEVKPLIGRKYNDQYVQKNLAYLPFKVQESASNEPEIVVTQNNKVVKKTPQEICTLILKRIKTDAESKLGHPIDKAVITVPAYFNTTQREETLIASQKAGFTVLKLLNEPTAAALSYYHEKTSISGEESFSLVYDLGGGTFDVAILSCKGTEINIIGVDGETHLGGNDFDNLLMEHVCQILINIYNYDPKKDARALRRLKTQCQNAKEYLSNVEETNIVLSHFASENDTIDIPITRVKFENLCKDLFQQTIDIVDRCLKNSNLTRRDFKEVILSGGSTRIPKLQSMIRDYFGGKTLCQILNPDECVAEGAAIQAAMLSTDNTQAIKRIKVTDVTPLPLGISDCFGLMDVVIKRNTPIPTSSTIERATVYNNQTSITFEVYEGEHREAVKNNYLGLFKVTGLTPAPPRECTASLTMNIDQNGILQVSAKETVNNKTKTVTIAYFMGRRNENVRKPVVYTTEYVTEFERRQEFDKLKDYLKKYCVGIKFNLEKRNLTSTFDNLYYKCIVALNTIRNLEFEDEEKLMELKAEIVALCDIHAKIHNFERMP